MKERRSMLVVKPRVTPETYNLFKNIYSRWKGDSRVSFQVPRPLNYRSPEAILERTWVKGKRALALYFLMPEQLAKTTYGVKPSIYVEKSAEFLAWLHNIRPNKVDVKQLQREHMSRMRIVIDSCLKSRLINKCTVREIEYELVKVSKYESWGPVSIVHGDFKTQNVLIAGKNLAIIDFESTRYDFSYLDLARFVYNIKLRLNKYPFLKERRINFLTSVFLRKYEKLCGKIRKRALIPCYLRDLLEELKAVLSLYSMKTRVLKRSVNSFLIKKELDYLVKELRTLKMI